MVIRKQLLGWLVNEKNSKGLVGKKPIIYQKNKPYRRTGSGPGYVILQKA